MTSLQGSRLAFPKRHPGSEVGPSFVALNLTSPHTTWTFHCSAVSPLSSTNTDDVAPKISTAPCATPICLSKHRPTPLRVPSHFSQCLKQAPYARPTTHRRSRQCIQPREGGCESSRCCYERYVYAFAHHESHLLTTDQIYGGN